MWLNGEDIMKNYTLRVCLVLLVCMFMCACSSNEGGTNGGSDEIVGTWMHINNEKYKDILEEYISEDIAPDKLQGSLRSALKIRHPVLQEIQFPEG